MQTILFRYRILICLVVGMFIIALAHPAEADKEAAMNRLARSNNAFALDLYSRLSAQKGNVFMSPYSISTALAMAYTGARDTTAHQMADTLYFSLPPDQLPPAFSCLAQRIHQIQETGEVTLQTANALWLQQGLDLLEAFHTMVTQSYQARVFQVDFQTAWETARQEINAWVEEATHHKITNLLPEGVITTYTRLVLTNAIYFKGNWAFPFDEDATQEAPFWISVETSVPVDLMYQQHSFKYAENDTVQVLELPYEGEELTMLIVLPKTKDGLAALEKRLSMPTLNAWLADIAYRDVQAYVPRLRLTSRFTLSETLKAMGMTEAFSDQADFSGITREEQLSITEVIHKAFVELNEEGTEAAAATGVVVGVTSVMEPQPIPVFKADHPFLFMIRDTVSESLLFLGRFVTPGD